MKPPAIWDMQVQCFVRFRSLNGASMKRSDDGDLDDDRAFDWLSLQYQLPPVDGGAARPTRVEDAVEGLQGFASFPTNIYIDRQGVVRHIHSGF